MRRLPFQKEEGHRGEQDSSKHVIQEIIIHSPHGRTCCTLSLSSADERFTSWESARFRGVKNWTMRRIAFSFLVFRRHFADGDTANSNYFVNRKNLSTNWPHDEERALMLTTVCCWCIVSYWSGREDSNLRPHGPETCNLTVRLLRCDHIY